jgi:prepilin-type N-terminal cleavage/methylation domain-containing protein
MDRHQALVNQRGFTLAELLVASAVLGLLMLGVFTLQRQGLQSYQIGAARVEVQQNGRAALETMFNEIRTAQAVTAVGATTITVTDQGGVAAVQYLLVGTTLQRNGIALIGGVQSLQIWCYDGDNVLTTTPGNVRSVQVRIRTQTESPVAASSDRDQHALMETRVRLRNL